MRKLRMLGVSHSRIRFALVFIAASFTRVERTRDSRGVIALVRIVRNSADAVGRRRLSYRLCRVVGLSVLLFASRNLYVYL